MTIRIMVVGERRLFRRALASALAAADDFHVVGDCGRMEEIDNACADVAIVDFDCPHGPSVDDFQPACPVLALTTEPMPTTIRHASSMSQVRGLLAKDRGLGQLIDVVRRVAAGERVFEPTRSMPRSDNNPLTNREIEILHRIAQGMSAADIAHDLRLRLGTVRNYVSVILRKTGSRNRLEAIRIADESGWL